jgi:hypothetical protein
MPAVKAMAKAARLSRGEGWLIMLVTPDLLRK